MTSELRFFTEEEVQEISNRQKPYIESIKPELMKRHPSIKSIEYKANVKTAFVKVEIIGSPTGIVIHFEDADNEKIYKLVIDLLDKVLKN